MYFNLSGEKNIYICIKISKSDCFMFFLMVRYKQITVSINKLIDKRDERKKTTNRFLTLIIFSKWYDLFFFQFKESAYSLMNLKTLNELNQDILIKETSELSFLRYGKIININLFEPYIQYLDQHTHIPKTLNQYIADDPLIHEVFKKPPLLDDIFGDMPLEYGYVNGNNSYLNALEFHPSPEINIAITPLVLMLGHTEDIKDFAYDVSQLEAFYVPANTAIVIYPTTLHFSPCKVSDDGFKCGVILPYGTNMAFISAEDKKKWNDPLLYKTNKRLLAHPDNKTLLDLGAYPGLQGKNIKIEYK